jgi:hypothetical protein
VTWWAYVDESMRQRRDGSGIYVLAAALVEVAKAEPVRHAVAGLVNRKHKFHWRDESPSNRRKAVELVAGIDTIHLVTVGTSMKSAKQERARRLCLEVLLWELAACGVEQVWLDSRTESLNRRDRALFNLLRVRGTIGDSIRVDFAHPFNGRDGEVLLWLPDIVAGAVSAARGDGDGQYLLAIEHLVSEHPVTLD